MSFRCFGIQVSSVATSLVAACLLVSACEQAEAEQISIAGSSTVRPIVDQAVKQFQQQHSDVKFVVGGGGSGNGVKLAGKGEIQIGMASRAMKDKEKEAYPELKPVKIGVDGIVVVVNKKNPVRELTTQQVIDIYTGKTTNWKDLGGEDAPIALISTNQKHGTFDAFAEHFKLEGKTEGEGAAAKLYFKLKDGGEYTDASARTADGNKKVLAALLTQPLGVAYASLGAAQALAAKGAPIQIVTLDGVEPTEASVVDGSYSVSRALFVLTKGEPTGTVKQFIDFLTGDEGQQIVKSLDYVPTGLGQTGR